MYTFTQPVGWMRRAGRKLFDQSESPVEFLDRYLIIRYRLYHDRFSHKTIHGLQQNSEPLNIERIIQASPATSGFRINVDGRKGDNFDNVRIAAKDSMYIFVEVTVNPNGKDQPLLIQDSIVFTYNSVKQTVLLEACGQDVKLIKGGQNIE